MSDHPQFSLSLEHINKYEFETRFDWEHLDPVLLDEPEPLGEQKGPNASRLVGAAVGNCLSASLIFCLEKTGSEIKSMKTTVVGELKRNDRGRLRIGKLDVKIVADIAAEKPQRMERCLRLFEDYCVVTASIRKGIDIAVTVEDPQGKRLYFNDEYHD